MNVATNQPFIEKFLSLTTYWLDLSNILSLCLVLITDKHLSMKIALIGYGKMGKEIEKIALERGHEIALKIDVDNQPDLTAENLKNCDVAIEFTTPASALSNYFTCFEAGIPVVSGTTGWLIQAEFIAPVLGTRIRSASPACGACFRIFSISSLLSKATSGL